MNVTQLVRAFALAAVAILMGASLAPIASAEIAHRDVQQRAERLEGAVAALQDAPTPETVAAVRAALDDLPGPLQSSPALREIDASLRVLEDPAVARLLLPLVRAGAFNGTTDLDALPTPDEMLARIEQDFGFDQALLAAELEALNASMSDLDLTSAATLQASIDAMPEDRLRQFSANLAAFTARWNETGGTEVASRFDAVAQDIARRPVADLGAEADADLAREYADAMALLADIRDAWAADMGLATSGELTAEDRAEYDAWLAQVRADAADAIHATGLDQDAFATLPLATEWPYTQASGPVAVDGVPLSLLGPETAESGWVPPPDPEDQQQSSGAVLSHREVANGLRLPGTFNAPFGSPVAIDGEYGTDAPAAPFGGAAVMGGAVDPAWAEPYWYIAPHEEDTLGHLGAGDYSDLFRVTLPTDHFIRLFLEVPAGFNADMTLTCEATGRTWDSWSDGPTSTRPYFDSVTFLNNAAPSTTGAYHGSAVQAFAPVGQAACPGGAFFLEVFTPTDLSISWEYLLRGDATPYDAKRCGYKSTTCGLNFVKWGDRCKDLDVACRSNHPDTSGNTKQWSQLTGAQRHPVIFIHGVGASYHSWVNMEEDGYYPGGVYQGPWGSGSVSDNPGYFKGLNMDSVARYKREALEWTVFAAGMIVYMTTLFAFTRAMIGFSIVQLMVNIAVATILINVAASLAMTLIILVKDAVIRWRASSSDAGSHFWAAKAAGHEVYWIEYNSDDNNARPGQIEAASRQVKLAISAVQQDFFDRHKDDAGFTLRAPEDVTVNLVVHSMGGLVTRMYMVDDRGYREGDGASQTYSSPIYEADVNKWISLQTPNMGSTPAKLADTIRDATSPTVSNLIVSLAIAVGITLALGGGTWVITIGSLTWFLIKFAVSTAVKAYISAKAGGAIKDREELIRDDPGIVKDFINARQPALDVDHGIIYGDPLNGALFGLKRFDLLVSEHDARGPPQLLQRMATQTIHDDHGSALFSEPAQRHILRWLRNPDDARLTRVPPDPVPPIIGSLSASQGHGSTDLPEVHGSVRGPCSSVPSVLPCGEPEAAAPTVLASEEAPARSLLLDFGQKTSADGDQEPGARYVPDGGAATLAAPQPFRAPAPSDPMQKLERLAMKKGLFEGATLGSAAGDATRRVGEALVANASESEVARRIDEAAAVFDNARSSPGAMTQARQLAADVAVVRSGHADEATRLLEQTGEPSVLVDAGASPRALDRRAVLLVPTGGLSGLDRDAYFAEMVDGFLARGGHVVVLAQERGADFAALPGGVEGFGYAEESGAYVDSVTFGTFTGALAGQPDATPDVLADGTLARWPENATVHLLHAKNGRPVSLTYPWHNGTVTLLQAPVDWALAAGRGSAADFLLARDLLAHVRAPDAAPMGAPGASVTFELELGPDAAGAPGLALVLVDDAGRPAHRENVAPAASVSWTVPANVTSSRHFEVDALLLDAEGNVTSRVMVAASGFAARFLADPSGFRPVLAPVSLDVTSATDRVERNGTMSFTLAVLNRGDAERTLTVGWFYPEHARASGSAEHGAGAPRAGAPPAWDDNFQLRANVTVPAGGSADLATTLLASSRTDALVARVYDEDGAVLAEARRSFTVYDPSVLVNVTTPRAVYASGETVTVSLAAREASAEAAAPVELRLTARAPSGLRVATRTTTATPGGAPATVSFALPADSAVGVHTLSVEALRAGTRVGGGSASFRVPGQQLVATPVLPAAFEVGVPATVAYDLSNPGREAISSATFTLRFLAPNGTEVAQGSAPFTLAPGDTTRLTFSLTPTTAALGTHRLAFSVPLRDDTFESSTPIVSSLSATVASSASSYRVRDALHAEARLANTGRFALPVEATLATDAGLDPVARALTLAPGERATLALDGALDASLASGTRALSLTLAAGGTTRNVTRTFVIPAASVTLDLADPGADVPAGATLNATLRNSGGVDAQVPWRAELVDATGDAVVSLTGVADVPAGSSAPLALTVPAQAAAGDHRLRVSAEAGGRPALRERAFHVDGVSATLSLSAPLSGAPGASVPVSARAESATLQDGTLVLEALSPVPLPAWRDIGRAEEPNAVAEAHGATWLGTDLGLVRVAADGSRTLLNRSDGLPADRVTALAVRNDVLYVGTEEGLAWRFAGGAMANATSLPGAPARDVTALAATSIGVIVGTSGGAALFDGAQFTPLSGFPEEHVTSLAAEGSQAWGAVAAVRGSFSGEDLAPVRKDGTVRAVPAIAVARNGDVWIAYADNTTTSVAIKLAHLNAKGTLLGVTVVATGAAHRTDPDVKVDSLGRVHVAWYDTAAGTGDVLYRRFGPDGVALGPETVVSAAPANQKFPKLAVAPDDSVWVAWQDDRDPQPPGSIINRGDELYASRILADGTVAMPERRMTVLSGMVLRPSIATDAQGNLHGTWTDAIRQCIDNDPNYCYPNLEVGYGKWAPDGSELVAPLIASVGDDHLSWLAGITVDANGSAHLAYQDARYQATELSYSRVSPQGHVAPRAAQLTSERFSPKSPDLVARPDGRLEMAWTDYRSGKEQAFHVVYDPATGDMTEPARVNSAATTTSYAIARNVRIAASTRGAVYATWSDERAPDKPTFRVAVFDQELLGRGIASIDLTGAASQRLRGGAGLASDDVDGLAMDARWLAVLGEGNLTLRDRATGASTTFAVAADATDVALRGGWAYVAAPSGLQRLDLATGSLEPAPDGAPALPAAFAHANEGLLVAGAGETKLALDDRDDVLWVDAMPATPGVAQPSALPLPDEPGRVVLRARVLSSTGQRLAETQTSVHALPEGLALALTPPTDARPGEPATLRVSVGNRGTDALRNVHVVVRAPDGVLLDALTSLDAGAAQDYDVVFTPSRSFDVDATATAARVGGPVDVPGESVSVRDHVAVAAPAITARILAPDVADREPFAVGALVANRGLFPARLLVSLDGGPARAVALAPGAQATLSDLAQRTALDDVALRLDVAGDARATLTHVVRAGERVRIADVEGLVGPVGERALSVRLQNTGTLDSSFAIRGAPVTVPALGEATLDLTVDVPAGVSTLALATPWETRDARLVGAADAVPLLAIDAVATTGGVAAADLAIENAGPGPLRGTVEVDFGFRSVTLDVDVPEGQTVRATPTVALTDAAPGPAQARATFVRAGAPVAEATRAFEVPGPVLAFLEAPGDRAANAGDTLALRYVVRNVGEVAGAARVTVALGAGDALARDVHLAPGQDATLDFAPVLDRDAPDGAMPLVATAPGAESRATVTVRGPRALVAPVATPPAAAPGGGADVTVRLENPTDAPLAVVLEGSYAGQRARTEATLAPGERANLTLPFEATEQGEARWSLSLPSGRVLQEGVTAIRVDTLASGVRVTTDADAYDAGGFINVTVTTTREGRVDLLGPGFRDAFDLNGTTTRTYRLAENLPEGRYALMWNFDGANLTGSLPLAVRGPEVRSVALDLASPIARAGDTLHAAWTVDSALAGRYRLRTWFEDASGQIHGASLAFVQVPQGRSTLALPRAAPEMEPGPARLVARLALLGADGDEVLLAGAAAPVRVPGLALRDAAAAWDGAQGIDVDVTLASGAPATVALVARAPTGEANATMPIEGTLTRRLALAAPEAGTYAIRVEATSDGVTLARDLEVRVEGVGIAPVTQLQLVGAAFERADGVIVITPDTAVRIVATDEGAGVAGTMLRDNDLDQVVEGEAFLAPGLHELTYWSWDLVGNVEDEQRATLFVDAAAPVVNATEPRPGSVHVAGDALPDAGADAVTVTPPTHLVDTDGDGYADAEETLEGSNATDPRSYPARWMPAAPPALERPIVAVGAMRVVVSAEDEGAGVASLALLLDGREVARVDAASADWVVDVSAEEPGHHEAEIVATDAVGNEARSRFGVFVAPTTLEGWAKLDATDPRLPPAARAMAAWAEGTATQAPDGVTNDLLRRSDAAQAAANATKQAMVDPLLPPVVTELPGHVEEQAALVQGAVDELLACGCLI